MHEQIATHEWFTTTEWHIERTEIRAVIYAIQAYPIQETEVHIRVDNMVFFHYLQKWGGKVRRLNSLICELWDYCQRMNVHVVPHYVPSKENQADVWGRQNITLAQASMHPPIMAILCSNFSWIGCTKGWMANAANAQCPRYISDSHGEWTCSHIAHARYL